MATKYEKLLADLLAKDKKEITIIVTETVALSGIRRGLKTAFANFNGTLAIMELPEVKGSISVSNRSAKGHVHIKLIDTTSPSYGFQYTILTDEEEEPNG